MVILHADDAGARSGVAKVWRVDPLDGSAVDLTNRVRELDLATGNAVLCLLNEDGRKMVDPVTGELETITVTCGTWRVELADNSAGDLLRSQLIGECARALASLYVGLGGDTVPSTELLRWREALLFCGTTPEKLAFASLTATWRAKP